MINILVEAKYKDNLRLNLLLDGLKYSIASKKGNYRLIDNLDDIEKQEKIVVVFGFSSNWIKENIINITKRNIHPILFGAKMQNSLLNYSYISKDYFNSFYNLSTYIFDNCEIKNKVAFLGYNRDSIHDSYKLNAFMQAIKQKNLPYDIIENQGNSISMIKEFIKHEQEYDAVIAANDSIMILYTSLSQHAKEKHLAGFGGLKISSYITTKFITSDIDYYEGGKILGNLYYFLNKQEVIYPTSIKLPSKLNINDEVYPESTYDPNEHLINFYCDKAVKEIDSIEKLFLSLDETDLKLLSQVQKGIKHEDIAESCFISVNTVKYRLGKMIDELHLSNKSQLLKLLEKYNIKL